MLQRLYANDDCIAAYNALIEAANRCLSEHLGEEEMADCLALCLDCIDLGGACKRMLQRGSGDAYRVSEVCAGLCERCGDECARFDSEACRACAEACRACAALCRTELAA